MKVLVLSHLYPSTADKTLGLFVHQQALALRELGCEVRVVSPVPVAPFPLYLLKEKWRGYARVGRAAEIEGIRVDHPRYLALPGALFFAWYGRVMYRLMAGLVADIYRHFRFEVIHAHTALPDGQAALLLRESYPGTKLVVTLHGQDLYLAVHRSQKCRAAVGGVLRAADGVVAVSERLRELAGQELGLADRVRVIGNGIDPQRFTVAASRPIFPPGRGPVMVSVSYLIPRKGIDVNLMALARLAGRFPELRCLVIGGGPEEPRLRKLSRDLGLEERVEFTGPLAHEAVIERLAGADVFCLPSRDEAFGVAYIEAMACGRPVIGCRGEGIAGLIEEGVNGLLIDPGDVEGLAEALARLLEDPARARQVGQAGRRLVESRYTWEANARQNLALYREVSAGG